MQLNLPRSRASGGDALTAAIQLVAASTGRRKKKKSPSFHFISSDGGGGHPVLSRNASSPSGWLPLRRRVMERREGTGVAARVSPCDPAREQGTLSSHAVRLKTLAATGESCQAFSGIDPARLWLAGGQKTKYFLLLQLGKEI